MITLDVQENPSPNVNSPIVPNQTPMTVEPAPTPSVVPPPVSEKKSVSKWLYVLLGLALIVLLSAVGYFVLLSKNNSSKQAIRTAPAITTNPTPTPISQANVDQTLTNTDTSLQQSTDQANTDLNQINSISTNQDTTNGL